MARPSTKTRAQEEAEDILILADLIGIGRHEAEYLWIAKEAFNADLPQGWQIFFDEEGRSFFFEVNKHISSYEHPSLDYYRKLYQDFKRKDAEFAEQQRHQEMMFGMREVATGGGRAHTAAETPGGLQPVESVHSQPDPDGDRERQEQSKTRLLQAYSNDPNLASKYRADIQEREELAAKLLRKGIEKEEEAFMKRLRMYVGQKKDMEVGTVEEVMLRHQREQDEKMEVMAEHLTQLMQEVKESAAQSATSPSYRSRGQGSRGHAGHEYHESDSKASSPVSPEERAERAARRAREAKEKAAGCESCVALRREVEELQQENAALQERARRAEDAPEEGAPRDGGRGAEATEAELAAVQLQLGDAAKREEKLQKELAQVRQMLAAGLGRAMTQDEQRAEMDALADEARRPPPPPSRTKGTRCVHHPVLIGHAAAPETSPRTGAPPRRARRGA